MVGLLQRSIPYLLISPTFRYISNSTEEYIAHLMVFTWASCHIGPRCGNQMAAFFSRINSLVLEKRKTGSLRSG